MANKPCKCVLLLALVTLLSCVSLTSVSAGPPSKNKYALIAASGTYEFLLWWEPAPGLDDYAEIMGYAPTPYNIYSAIAYHDLLVNDFGWKDKNIKMLLSPDSTKQNILDGIRWLKEKDGPDSLFFIFIGGHGWTAPDSASLIPGDEDYYSNLGSRLGHDPWDEITMCYDSIPTGADPENHNTLYTFLWDDELKLLFDELEFEGKIVFFHSACAGSGFIEDIERENMFCHAKCDSDRNEMFWGTGENACLHDYYLIEAFRGATGAEIPFCDLDMDPDINGDGKVSVEEAHSWMIAAMDATDPTIIGQGGGPTAIIVLDGIEGETFL